MEKGNHRFVKCLTECGKLSCWKCSGKIQLCIKCEGANKSLTRECCGYTPDMKVLERVANGELDYYHSSWRDRNGDPIDLPIYMGWDSIC